MFLCKACKKKQIYSYFDYGNIPISSHLFKKQNYLKNKIRYKIGECKNCGLIQLINFPDIKKLQPPFKWIFNKEENSHHQNLFEKLINDKIINKNSKIMFTSHYDELFNKYAKNNKFKKLFNLDIKKNFNIKNFYYRQEIIQNTFNLENSNKIIDKKGKFDAIFVSSILDHTHNLNNFFKFYKNLLKDRGVLIIEVPDNSKSLKQGNALFIWEEHTFYFEKNSLNNLFLGNGYSVLKNYKYQFKQEDSLIGVYKKNIYHKNKNKLFKPNKLLDIFHKKFKKNLKLAYNFFDKFNTPNIDIVIFGAGHNSAKFIHLYNLKNIVKYVIDDNKNKNNLYISDTKIKIIDKNSYLKKNINSILCLIGANIKHEKKIKEIFTIKTNKKIFFKSIYSDSKIFFLK